MTRDYEVATDVVISVDNSNGDTASSWLISATEGFGLYGKAALVSTDWVAGTYQPLDVVWETGKMYLQIDAASTTTQPSATPAIWQPDTDAGFPLDSIIADPSVYGLVTVAAIDHVYTHPIDTCLATKLAAQTLNPCASSELKQDITDIKFNLDAIDIFMFTLDTLNAERSAQLANDICNKKICF